MKRLRFRYQKKHNRECVSFTLVELLVVITIIIILVSIMLPALNKVKNKTFEISCKNNLKNLGVTMISYGQDYNQQLPYWNIYLGAFRDAHGEPGNLLWEMLNKKSDLFYCPACPIVDKPPKWNGYTLASGEYLYLLYDDRNTFMKNPTFAIVTDKYPWGTPDMRFYHGGGLNILFLDGHVKWFSGTMSLGKAYNFRLWDGK